MAQHLE
jgi:hypothetical protein